ncbi:MAG: hypothetical protein AAGG48_10655 [Planctomycetota bacterium]
MQLAIRFSGNSSVELRSHDYESVMTRSLERFRHRLNQVQLFIEDVNGPRGGIDKQCRCVLHVHRMAPVVIQDRDESIASLIHRVANRATYTLSQKLDRKRKRVKQDRKTRKG